MGELLAADPCGKSLTTYQERVASLDDDAEIAYVNDLVSKRCHLNLPPPVRTVAYKVRVNADTPIAEVAMACQDYSQKKSLSAGETAVTFQVPPGACALTLEGNVPMNTKVTVPSTGGQVQCMIRGGRLECS